MNKKEQHILDAARYAASRRRVIQLLGGKCAVCGCTENLEIDHIKPEDKELDVSRTLMRNELTDEVLKEIAKCQALCHKHHMQKSIRERGDKEARGTHGTLSAYRYCKCILCTAAHSQYCLAYNKKKKLAKKRRLARERRVQRRLEGGNNAGQL